MKTLASGKRLKPLTLHCQTLAKIQQLITPTHSHSLSLPPSFRLMGLTKLMKIILIQAYCYFIITLATHKPLQ